MGTQSLEYLIRRLLTRSSKRQLSLFFHKHHEADIADALEEMSQEEQRAFFRLLQPEIGADVLEVMEPELQRQLMATFKTDVAAKFIEEMEPDDAADLLEDLQEGHAEKVTEIIDALPKAEAAEIEGLMAQPENSAGAIMTSEFISIPEDLSISEAIEHYRKLGPEESERAFYVFIVDQKGRLKGYVDIRTLLITPPNIKVKEVRNDYPITIPVDMDQEEVAKKIQKYDLVVAPVINESNRLVGIITVDDIVDVVVEEATEDLLKLSGTGDIEESKLLFGRLRESVFSRLPWLFMTIFGGILAAKVMTIFSHVYPQRFVPLAVALSFVPLLMGLAGNVGNQSATIIVRGIATGALQNKRGIYFVLREIGVGLSIGGIVGAIVFLCLWIMQQPFELSVIISLSIWVNMMVATAIGASLPMLFQKIKIDPAIASAPFISTALDIIGQIIYFVLTLGFVYYVTQ